MKNLNNRAGVLINYPSGMAERNHAVTGKHCSNYRAEAEALMKTVNIVENLRETATVHAVVFPTGTRSVLEALTNYKAP